MRAGRAIAMNVASRSSRRYIADTGAAWSEVSASPVDATAEPTMLIAMRPRLLKTSAR